MNRKERRTAAKLGQAPSNLASGDLPGVAAAPAVATDAAALLGAGIKHHDAGRFAEAEACYRRVLAIQPDHADALHLLGVIARQARRPDVAVELIGQAIKRNERNPVYFFNRGVALQEMRRLEEAVASYGEALAIKPDYAEAHYSRGSALYELRRLEEALASFEKVLALKPGYAEAFIFRGSALHQLKRFDEALASFDKALALRPDYAEAFYNRGCVLQELKRPAEAVASFDKALALKPDFAEAFNNRGVALHELKRFDEALASYDRALALRPHYPEALYSRGVALQELQRLDEAVASFHKAVMLRPGYAQAFNNCGNALLELKRIDEALASFGRALALKPDFAEAFNSRGVALQELKRLDEALACYDNALALKPDYAQAFYNRGVALQELKRLGEALASYDAALALAPDHVHAFSGVADCVNSLCDWDRKAALAGDVIARIADKKSFVSPLTLLGYSGEPLLQLQCATNFVADKIPLRPRPFWTGARWRNDRIRIAYLSADFRQHPVAQLIAELFERHDRSAFEVIGISLGPDDRSDLRARIVAGVDRFHDVRATSDYDVARRLNEIGTDIAVDLTGYTLGNRPKILSFRPAPVAVSFLGFAATMGADFIDYIIADRVALPFDSQAFYIEKIVHLPDSFQPNDSRRAIAEPTPRRAELGLPDDAVVFCCFNNHAKITAPVFDVWMRLLKAVEPSVLWLADANGALRENLERAALARGVDPTRLVFAPRLERPEDHLARHRAADLFLDTLPYNAHTTASDALWAGLPVLTCRGQSFAGRVAASLLEALGLPELVTASLDDYEALALRLATDRARLAAIKAKLERNRLTSPLFDTDRFRRHIEAAYRTMWDTWQRGEQPRSFAVEPKPVSLPS